MLRTNTTRSANNTEAAVKARIHLVDDEVALLWVVEQYLTMRGYEVTTSDDPRQALVALQRETPDLVLLDVLMPNLNGFKLFGMIRQIPALMSVPVIFLTAMSDLPTRLSGFRLGADDYIIKPFEVSLLEARVSAVLRRTRKPTELGLPYLDTNLNVLLFEGREVTLTGSESAIMAHLLKHVNELVRTEDLLHGPLGYAEGTGNLSTVRYHIARLRAKLKKGSLKGVQLKTVGHSGYTLGLSDS